MRPLRALALSLVFGAGVLLLIWATFAHLKSIV